MHWQQLILHVDAADLPKAEALLKLAGAEAISLHGEDGGELFEPPPGATPLWQRIALRALFTDEVDMSAMAKLLRSALASDAPVEAHPLRDEDWNPARRGRIETVVIGRLLLAPAEESEPRAHLGAAVRLHMGLAFGTGRHPTTRLCLEWLESRLEPSARVLDFGAGSGILSVAALALGAERVWAVDIDPQALIATRENARLNSCADRLWVGTPEAFSAAPSADAGVDVVVANILAGPLQSLASSFARYLKPGGRVVLSGLLEAQCDAVEAAYAAHFDGFERTVRDGWARLCATVSPKRAAPCS